MSTDFRALCRELTDVLAELPFGTCEELVVRARAALAEPEPKDDVALLREALAATAAQRRAEDDARAALAADGPAVPEGREPASVVDQPSDEEIIQEAIKADLVYRPVHEELSVFSGFVESHALNTYVLSFARAVLSRWGHQPAPVAAGEVGELVEWLRLSAECADESRIAENLSRAADLLAQRHSAPVPVSEGVTDEEWYALVDRLWDKYQTVGPQGERSVYEYAFLNACEEIARYGRCYPEPVPPVEEEVGELVALIHQISLAWEPDACLLGNMTAGQLTRAADLLAQRHPEPVPVAERWPEFSDCDRADDRVWCFSPELSHWKLSRIARTVHSHWLPAHALPLPMGEVE